MNVCQILIPLDVPLLQRSLTLWYELRDYYENNKDKFPEHGFEGQELLSMCGGLMIGKRGSEIIEGTLRSIEEHSLPHQVYSAAEVKARYPVFDPQEDEIGIYEDNAGYLHPELCIESYVHMAVAAGATAKYGEKLLSFEEKEVNGKKVVSLTTTQGKYTCDKLVLTVGVWAPELYGQDLSQETMKLWCERRVLYWFKPKLNPDQSNYYKVLNIILMK